MRTCALLALCLSVFATSASAITGELSIQACPGDASATQALDLDCAGGGSVALFGVFATSIDFPDLVALEGILEIGLANSTLAESPFWDFQSGNRFSVHERRPAQGCADYVDIWNEAGSQSAFVFRQIGPAALQIELACARSTSTPVTAGEKLFGFQAVVDMGDATQAGGGFAGCPAPLEIDWMSVSAESWSGNSTDEYGVCHLPPTYCTPKPPLSKVLFNGTAVPTLPRSWGRLKSLYR